MPMTFLSHQAVILPLKIVAPRWTSGTALVLGSMAPDVEYFLRGYPVSIVSHTWLGQLTFCLPVTLVLYWVVTRVIAEAAAAHVPAGGELRLREYALLREQPAGLRHLAIVASSAVIGSSSHVALDRLLVVAGGMPYHSLFASRSWVIANVVLWFVLAAVTLLLMRHIARRGLLRRWADERAGAGDSSAASGHAARTPRDRSPTTVSRQANPAIFWGWVTLGMLTGAALGAYYRKSGWFLHGHAAWIHIWLCSVSGAFVALVFASAAWHAATARSVHLRDQEQ